MILVNLIHRFLPLAWQIGPPPTNVRAVLPDGTEVPATLERTGRRAWLATFEVPQQAGAFAPRVGMLPAKTELAFCVRLVDEQQAGR